MRRVAVGARSSRTYHRHAHTARTPPKVEIIKREPQPTEQETSADTTYAGRTDLGVLGDADSSMQQYALYMQYDYGFTANTHVHREHAQLRNGCLTLPPL
mgnify:CR=1 FL=1